MKLLTEKRISSRVIRFGMMKNGLVHIPEAGCLSPFGPSGWELYVLFRPDGTHDFIHWVHNPLNLYTITASSDKTVPVRTYRPNHDRIRRKTDTHRGHQPHDSRKNPSAHARAGQLADRHSRPDSLPAGLELPLGKLFLSARHHGRHPGTAEFVSRGTGIPLRGRGMSRPQRGCPQCQLLHESHSRKTFSLRFVAGRPVSRCPFRPGNSPRFSHGSRTGNPGKHFHRRNRHRCAGCIFPTGRPARRTPIHSLSRAADHRRNPLPHADGTTGQTSESR